MNSRIYQILGIFAVTLSSANSTAASRPVHYGAVDHPRIKSCDESYWRGENELSRDCYQLLLQSDAPTEILAEAAWALGDLQLANRLFQQSLRNSPGNVSARVRWGDLFAASHQEGEAMNIYREALSTDPNHGFANLGAARVLARGFDDAASTYLDKLVNDAAVPPGARVGAWLLIARVALENGNDDEAAQALHDAETLIIGNDWPPLDLYALRAAQDLLNDRDGDDDWTARSLAYNDSFGDIFAVPAHFYVITRRYRDAIDYYQKAVDTEPGLAAAHEELGVNLLRDNQFSRARQHLERAHDIDPFSPKAVNTLRLLDSFEDFELITDPREGTPDDELPLVFRLHEDEASAIVPYATELARDSIAEFTAKYGFELREPVVVEMYPDHEDFAVRTAGMPGIGILGATFGYVVAMDSPSARPPEHFQWGTTLWHEMAHVFTLEATNHLVPRWFSEGVSVFEEWRSGPNQGVRIPLSVYGAMRDEKFLPIAELDEGFIRPTYEDQIIVSYMQAGLVCQFIDTRFGASTLQAMLYKYRDGMSTREVVEDAASMSAEQFDREFADFIREQHGDFLDNLDDWQRTHQSLANLIAEEAWATVPALAEHAIALQPQYVEPDSPYIALARAQEELGDRESAILALQSFWRAGGYDPDSLQRLGQWLVEAGRRGDAIEVLKSVLWVDPLAQDLHGKLGDLMLAEGHPADALREFRVALSLEPHDLATAHFRIAQAYHALGRMNESQSSLLMALDVAPNFRPAQKLLLEVAQSVDRDL